LKEILVKQTKKSSIVFENKKTEEKRKFFYKLKKLKNWKKEKKQTKKNYFREIYAKKIRYRMNQQLNEQCKKGPQQTDRAKLSRQKDVLPRITKPFTSPTSCQQLTTAANLKYGPWCNAANMRTTQL